LNHFKKQTWFIQQESLVTLGDNMTCTKLEYLTVATTKKKNI